MKSKPGPRLTALSLLVLAGFVSLIDAPSAIAHQATAGGSVTVIDPAGVGVAYSVQTQALSAIFLSGQQGEPLSLSLSGAGGNFAPGQQVTGNGNVIVLSSDVVSVHLTGFSTAGSGSTQQGDYGPLIVLAQFN